MEKESEIPKQDQKDEIEEITEKAAELANVKSQLNDVEHEVEVTGRIQSGATLTLNNPLLMAGSSAHLYVAVQNFDELGLSDTLLKGFFFSPNFRLIHFYLK